MITTIREQTFKERFIYPHLEDIVVGKDYAFTISPKIQMRSFTETYLSHMDQIHKLLSPNVDYKLRPEISTQSTILHFHGVIRFKRAVKISAFYYHTIPLLKDFCTFTIKQIEDYEWYLYCIKSRHIMKSYLEHCRLPYKLYSCGIYSSNATSWKYPDSLHKAKPKL